MYFDFADQSGRKKGEHEGHEVKRKGHKELFVTSFVFLRALRVRSWFCFSHIETHKLFSISAMRQRRRSL